MQENFWDRKETAVRAWEEHPQKEGTECVKHCDVGKSLSCYPHFRDEDTEAQRGEAVRSRLGLRFSVSKSRAFYLTSGCLADGLNHKFCGPDVALLKALTFMRFSLRVTDHSSKGTEEGRGYVVRTGILSHRQGTKTTEGVCTLRFFISLREIVLSPGP